MSPFLRRLSLAFAWLGGAAASAVALMTVISVVTRAVWSQPIAGDVEITQFGIALAISLCLPWCQLHQANIIVDFFTQKLSPAAQARLDAVGAVLLALMCALLAWRTTMGALNSREFSETSMILSLPMWWAYASLAPGLALTALVALHQAATGWRGAAANAPHAKA
jgi:TRAP-type C4-dicarboxylate transport system permease small subunit